jgi:RimJ/RimL family protein N-acetyltransferase
LSLNFAESERLLYEVLLPEHAQGLFEALGDPRIYEHIGNAPPASVTELAVRIASKIAGPPAHRARERWLNYAVRLKATDTLIGWLQATIIQRRAEVAYLFDPRFWGHGYATEAMSAFQDHLCDQEYVAEFWATTAPGNAQSIRLLERLGYTPVTTASPCLLSYEEGDLVFALR